ncbi:hypothetical protein CDL12_10384 [Handroanthus impetiginosus]|uniref:Uncharacterized protein n=1 Tax=Handroanthus impetiginosus TaxID=429701 RepID=A0A2G9HHF3_9LAMI|nr:hypothetical protein CDL12_10384 [Handroanthus impetiginosus]
MTEENEIVWEAEEVSGCQFMGGTNVQSSQQPPMQSSSTATTKRDKLPVRKNLGVKIRGKSNHFASVKLNQSSSVSTPVIVKGGLNFVTVSNLQSAQGNHKRKNIGEVEKGDGSVGKGKKPKK